MLTLTHPMTGAEYEIERLSREPGGYVKGFCLSLLGQRSQGYTCNVYQRSDGRQECDCGLWTECRECEHTKLLTAAGLLDEPVNPDDGAWDLDETIELADAL
jgi:hypothetical protein